MLSVSSWKIDSSDVNMVVSFFYDLNTFSLTSLFQFSDYIVWRCKRCLRGRHLSIFHTSNKLSLSCNSSPDFSFAPLVVVPLLVPVILLHFRLLVEDTSNLESLQKKRKSAFKPRFLSKVLDSLSIRNTPHKDIYPLDSLQSDPDAKLINSARKLNCTMQLYRSILAFNKKKVSWKNNKVGTAICKIWIKWPTMNICKSCL